MVANLSVFVKYQRKTPSKNRIKYRRVLIFYILLSRKYVRNELVKIRLKDFEMASHFLGAVRHITLLESEADLIGLYRPFIEKEPKENSETPKDDAKK